MAVDAVNLLLTSAGIQNRSIVLALRQLLDREFADANIVFITTAAVALRGDLGWLVEDINRVYSLGWKEFNVLEINGLPRQMVLDRLEAADVIYVGGGNAYHLARSITDAEVASDLLGLLCERVYVGVSAGSMIFSVDFTERMTALFGEHDEVYMANEARLVSPFDLFDWFVLPHVDFDLWDSTAAERLGRRVYAIDDQTALRVVDGEVDVVSEGRWRLLD